MDDDRGDYDNPLLFGFRASARPLRGLEIGLERTAQLCGDGRSCTWDDFWNMWWGNDNAGENVDPKDEPGNQLAGWDLRWASPIGDWPYAIYWQHTGETIDNQIPLFGTSASMPGLGAVASYGVNPYQEGLDSGEYVVQVLQGKLDLATAPIQIQDAVLLTLNPAAAEKQGVTLPQELLDKADKLIE